MAEGISKLAAMLTVRILSSIASLHQRVPADPSQASIAEFGLDGNTLVYNPPMPRITFVVVVGSWLALVLMTVLAFRFNRSRGDD